MKRLIIITFIVITIVVITMFPVFVGYIYGTKPNITEFCLQYTSILLSSTSFIAVIYTIWKQNNADQEHQVEINQNYEFARQNYDMQILNAIEKFSSESMIECKRSCDIILSKRSNSNFMKEFRNVLKDEACGYLNSDLCESRTKSEAYKCFMDFIQITRFFNVLSFYQYNATTANAIQYYYDYYRILFVFAHRLYNEILEELPSDQVKNHKDYFYTQWSNILMRFDEIMKENEQYLQVKKQEVSSSMGGVRQFC